MALRIVLLTLGFWKWAKQKWIEALNTVEYFTVFDVHLHRWVLPKEPAEEEKDWRNRGVKTANILTLDSKSIVEESEQQKMFLFSHSVCYIRVFWYVDERDRRRQPAVNVSGFYYGEKAVFRMHYLLAKHHQVLQGGEAIPKNHRVI